MVGMALKRIPLILVIVVALAVAVVLLRFAVPDHHVASSAGDGVAIRFEPAAVSLGVIHGRAGSRDKVIEFEYAGLEPLVISSVQAGCGCLVATMDELPLTLSNGERKRIRISADTARMFIGKYRYNITLHGPEGRTLGVCPVDYEYRSFFSTDAEVVSLMPDLGSDSAQATFEVRVPAGVGAVVSLGLRDAPGDVAKELLVAGEPSDQFRVKVSVPAHELHGITSRSVLRLSVPDIDGRGTIEHLIPLRVNLSQYLSAIPRSMQFGNVPVGASIDRVVLLGGEYARRKDLAVKSTVDVIEPEIEMDETTGDARLRIRFNPKAVGLLNANIAVECNGLRLDIPVVATVGEGVGR